VPWTLVLAWSVAAVCALLAWRVTRAAARLVAPAPSTLLNELLAEVGASAVDSEFARRATIAELNRRLSDVSFELASLPARFTALARISLASGTALALFGYIGASASLSAPFVRVLELVGCGASGLFGAGGVLAFGRSAKVRSAAIREEWDRTSREIAKTLGTSLSGPGGGGRT